MFGQKLARPFARFSALSPASFALVVAAFASPQAFAGGPRVGVSIDFVVPLRLPARHVRVYEPYHVGHAWYAPHRHAHVIYSFPVRTPRGIVYRPYTYCGERIVRTDYIPRFDPRFDDVHLGYHAPVFDGPAYRAGWLHRSYFEHPRRHAARHDRYDRHDRYHPHDRWDRHDGRPARGRHERWHDRDHRGRGGRDRDGRDDDRRRGRGHDHDD